MVAGILYQASETKYAQEQFFNAREREDLSKDPHPEVAAKYCKNFSVNTALAIGLFPLLKAGHPLK